MDKYFSNSKNNFPVDNGTEYLNNLENEILNELSGIYKAKPIKLENELKNEGFEEEKFLRGNIFKRQVPIIYQSTCAISGL
ncbi:MAG: hypothetical protein L3J09_09305 [Flavobacteriaceae bacterium]|nr:hypothetical protein [Flavobacteriaceae bacterium]